MMLERKSFDLRALKKTPPLEIVYSFDEDGEYEPTTNLIPLAIAVDLGLAKVVRTEGENLDLYVVTPTVTNTQQESDAPVKVVSAEWSRSTQKKEVTTFLFTNCTACGAPLVDNDTKEITQEKLHCSHCNTQNQGTSPKTKTIEIQELKVESAFEEDGWWGTVEELTKEAEAYQAKGRLKRLFAGEPAPLDVIRKTKNMVEPGKKILITGPFSDSEVRDVFVQIGKLETSGKREGDHKVVSRGEGNPRTPGSYLLDETGGLTDRGDYVVIIESDSGEKLPLVIMNDRDEKPSRFAVPVDALLNEGWKINIGTPNIVLNEIIEQNQLLERDQPDSVRTEQYGTVKVFFWNTDSTRHEQITDELYNNDLGYDDLWVSADIPHHDVSALHIEQR